MQHHHQLQLRPRPVLQHNEHVREEKDKNLSRPNINRELIGIDTYSESNRTGSAPKGEVVNEPSVPSDRETHVSSIPKTLQMFWDNCECVRVEKIDGKLYGTSFYIKDDLTTHWVRRDCQQLDNKRCKNKWKGK